MTWLKASVVTAVYNGEKFLEQTIQSVLNQTYPCEYLVFDDGSTDRTAEICLKYKVKYFYHKNIGENATVNRGFDLASGDILCVLSADDILYQDAVKEAVDYIGDYFVAYPSYDVIDDQSKVAFKMAVPDWNYRTMVREHHCFPGVGTFISKKLYKTQKRDTSYVVSDFDYWLRAGLKGDFIHIPKFLGAWRVHKEQVSVTKRKIMGQDALNIIENLFQNPDLPPDVLAIKDAAMKRARDISELRLKRPSRFYEMVYGGTNAR